MGWLNQLIHFLWIAKLMFQDKITEVLDLELIQKQNDSLIDWLIDGLIKIN